MTSADIRAGNLLRDVAAADRQRAQLQAIAGDGALRDRLIGHLVDKRGELAEETAPSATRVAVERLVDGDGMPVLLAKGEILLAGPEADLGVRLLQRVGSRCSAGRGP